MALNITATKSAAEVGDDSEAAYELAFKYERGQGGIKQNYKEALKWYKIASKEGNTLAKKHLVNMTAK